MNKNSKLMLWAAVALGVGFVVYKEMNGGAPSGYTSVQVTPGASLSVPLPANGQAALILPAGARGWTLAKLAAMRAGRIKNFRPRRRANWRREAPSQSA